MHFGILPRKLDGRLIGLSPRVAEKRLISERQLYKALGKLDLCQGQGVE